MRGNETEDMLDPAHFQSAYAQRQRCRGTEITAAAASMMRNGITNFRTCKGQQTPRSGTGSRPLIVWLENTHHSAKSNYRSRSATREQGSFPGSQVLSPQLCSGRLTTTWIWSRSQRVRDLIPQLADHRSEFSPHLPTCQVQSGLFGLLLPCCQ